MARKPTDIAILSLRVREEFRRSLEREAKKHGRSMHAEIIHRLTQSFVAADQADLNRQYVDMTSARAADMTAKKVVEQLRSEIARDRQDEPSLLGSLKPTIIEALSKPAPIKSAITDDEEGKS